MRKIKAFITAIILTVTLTTAVYGEEVRAYDQCSGTYTSEMKKPIEIKESKLTSLSYVKKICKITDTYKYGDRDIYKLDNGKGVLSIDRDNKHKLCVIVKDGELYGRMFSKTDKGITLTYNWHDEECSIKGFKATEEEIIYLTLISSEALADLAKTVIDYIN